MDYKERDSVIRRKILNERTADCLRRHTGLEANIIEQRIEN